jgi:hypothetical protein
LKDLVERFSVVSRISAEQQETLNKVDEVTKRLQKNVEERKKGTGNLPDLERRFAGLRNDKKEALKQARSKTIELIEANKKYQAFKIRRIIHAWIQFSAVMREKYSEVSDLFRKLGTVLEGLRDRE